MMYDMYLANPSGQRIKHIPSVIGVNVVLASNTYNVFTIATSSDFVPFIKKNGLIDVRRAGYPVVSGFIRKWSISNNEVAITCVEYNYLLAGRIVAYAAGSSEASKTDYADDMIKEIVSENIGSGAGAARQVDITIQGDSSAGETVSKSFSRRKVLAVCQELALESAQKGTRVYFGFRPTMGAELSLTFETAIDQWGRNRSFSSEAPIIFGEALGNLEDYVETYDYMDEINDVYVGGQGLGDQRLVEQVTDTVAATADRWARREGFLNMSNELTSTALISAGDGYLRSNRGKETFSASLFSTPTTQFGRDWFFGDRVAIMQNGKTLDGIVDKVRIRMRNNRETLDAVVEGNL